MSYLVRYGFAKNQEELRKKFLSSCRDYDQDELLITSEACFSDYLYQRSKYESASFSDVYYSLYCNPDMLKELLIWINSLNSGVKVELVKEKSEGKLVGYDYKPDDNFMPQFIYKDYQFGNQFLLVSNKIQIKAKVKGLSISRCAIKIAVSGDTLASKASLEYLVLVLIRTLDKNELFFSDMNEKTSIIKNIINTATGKNMGHCLYAKKISIDDLKYCFSTNNMNKAVYGDWKRNKQTSIIDSILSIKRNEY